MKLEENYLDVELHGDIIDIKLFFINMHESFLNEVQID